MIVSGEASGDLHGAHLVQALKNIDPGLRFYGMGGGQMAEAGVEILFDSKKVAVVGLFEVFAHLSDIIAAQKCLRGKMERSRPRLLILIDFPDFNLMLAAKAKKLGIPVFYYISPQVWAWRSGRVKTMRKRVDRIGVILPFEESFFRQRGVQADYVGHPLLDSVHARFDRATFCDKYSIDQGATLVGLLPGSRKKELSSLLPTFLDAAEKLAHSSPTPPVFLLPVAPTLTEAEILANGVDAFKDRLDIRLIHEDRYELMAACDAVVAASGTVTLELAILETPMVVVYKVSPITYHLGRMLVKIKYFSLVNLIADAPIVTELLQDQADADAIEHVLLSLLYDPKSREKMAQDLRVLHSLLGNPGASERAARLALEVMQE